MARSNNTHCKHCGKKLTERNRLMRKRPDGSSFVSAQCKQCRREYARQQRAAKAGKVPTLGHGTRIYARKPSVDAIRAILSRSSVAQTSGDIRNTLSEMRQGTALLTPLEEMLERGEVERVGDGWRWVGGELPQSAMRLAVELGLKSGDPEAREVGNAIR